MSLNLAVDSDARRRPLLLVAPFLVRRSLPRYSYLGSGMRIDLRPS